MNVLPFYIFWEIIYIIWIQFQADTVRLNCLAWYGGLSLVHTEKNIEEKRMPKFQNVSHKCGQTVFMLLNKFTTQSDIKIHIDFLMFINCRKHLVNPFLSSGHGRLYSWRQLFCSCFKDVRRWGEPQTFHYAITDQNTALILFCNSLVQILAQKSAEKFR